MHPTTCIEGNASISRRLRWASLAKSALGVAVAVGALTAGQAQAVVVNVGGQDYDVTTFYGSYNDNLSKFNFPADGGAMPWYGNPGLASSFATAIGNALGFPNRVYEPYPSFGYLDKGPYFTSGPDSGLGLRYYYADIRFCSSVQPCPGGIGMNYYGTYPSFDSAVTWAQVYVAPAPPPQPPTPNNSTVPGPFPIFGVATAFGYSRKLRMRIKGNLR
jgi:hypothetical protein